MNDPTLIAVGSVAGMAALGFGPIVVEKTVQLVATVRHRRRVRQAVNEGWTQPAVDAAWELTDTGAPYQGVSGISRTPRQVVPVTEWTREARKRQREVEAGWLRGIARAKAEQDRADDSLHDWSGR